MPRYGRDIDARYPDSSDPHRYGRPDARGAMRGAGPAGPLADSRWDTYPEGAGWSGPGQERYGAARGGELSMPMRDWETGQPWGGTGDADRVRAGDIMTENPEAVTPDTPLVDVASRMRDLDVGIIPVVDDLEGSRLRGVITDRDIAVRAVAEGRDIKRARVADFMSTNVEAVHESDSIRRVFTVMKRERVRRVPVVDDEGRLVGIIAQADLAVGYAGLHLRREAEVEEVLERVSEPAHPAWGREGRGMAPGERRYLAGGGAYDQWSRGAYDHDLGERIRRGWNVLRREARQILSRGYDRGW